MTIELPNERKLYLVVTEFFIPYYFFLIKALPYCWLYQSRKYVKKHKGSILRTILSDILRQKWEINF